MDIQHCPGTQHGNKAALSRYGCEQCKGKEEKVTMNDLVIEISPMKTGIMRSHRTTHSKNYSRRKDNDISSVRRRLIESSRQAELHVLR